MNEQRIKELESLLAEMAGDEGLVDRVKLARAQRLASRLADEVFTVPDAPNYWPPQAIRKWGEDIGVLVHRGTHAVFVDLDHDGQSGDTWTFHVTRTPVGWDTRKSHEEQSHD